jgi:hypothetical protein
MTTEGDGWKDNDQRQRVVRDDRGGDSGPAPAPHHCGHLLAVLIATSPPVEMDNNDNEWGVG